MSHHTNEDKLGDCKLLAFDFDGVFTDNKVYINEKGEEMIRCDRSDTFGLKELVATDVAVIILSTEVNDVVLHRAKKLGIPVTNNIPDKGKALKDEIKKRGLTATEVVYVGNDVNDLPAFKVAGFSIAVADAHPSVQSQVDYTTKAAGGDGAVREVIELILSAKQ